MAIKRKISTRKVLQALITLVVTGGCIVALVSASKIQNQKRLNTVTIDIKNEGKYRFVNKDRLWKQLVEERGIQSGKTAIDRIDIKAIEKNAYEDPWVGNAQVYLDNGRNMHITLTQRQPVARIFLENGQSRYLDTSLRLLPVSDQFTYYTTIVTNVPLLHDDSISRDMKFRVIRLVKFIENSRFWNAQIAQVMVTPDRMFELIPVMGKHTISIGDTSRLEEKFDNIFAFYKNVLNKIGWDKYDNLDARFAGQIVASPALPWSPPSKNALSNMDWVKSIMASDPDSGRVVKTSAVVTALQQPVKPVVKTQVIHIPTVSAKIAAPVRKIAPVKKEAAAPLNVGKAVTEKKKTEVKKTSVASSPAPKKQLLKDSKEQKDKKETKQVKPAEHQPVKAPKYIYQDKKSN
jgi:cell division protein FtsQ